MSQNKEEWYKKQSPLKQIAILFLLSYIIWFFALWLSDKFLLDNKHSFAYYILDTLVMSVLMTLGFGWGTIKSIREKASIADRRLNIEELQTTTDLANSGFRNRFKQNIFNKH
jgi:hypothetical protein